ncbi:MAG: 5,10-methylenetetrahydromethanopterin reductase [Acidimicrobiales bacterium]|jgi:5,10-methylenetetrahydromethanopterin reductase
MVDPMGVSIGLNRWDWRTPQTFAESVRHGESVGISHAFTPVNPLSIWDPYVLMAAGVMNTTTMRFGPLLETPVLRSPAVAAGSIASIAELSDGRAMLTYGIGDTAVRWLGKRPARIAELELATIETRALLAGERLDVGADELAFLRHARPVPVWLACGGPKSLRMAGRVADGVFLRVGTNPANLRAAVNAVRSGAVEAGREPSEVSIGVIVHTVTSQDPAEIKSITRAMAAGFYEYSPALFEQAGFAWNGTPIEELKEQLWPDFHHAKDLVAAGSLVDFLDDEVAASFSFFGSSQDVIDQITDLLAEVPGVDILVPHPVPMPVRDQMADYVNWLGHDILPAI